MRRPRLPLCIALPPTGGTLSAEGYGNPLRTARHRGKADEWALALASEGLHPAIQREGDGYSICVPEREWERAREVLEAYDAENRRAPPPRESEPVDGEPLRNAILASAALAVFFLVTGVRRGSSIWFERGSADAAKLLSGEPWRAITALTLHADAVHVASNALAGALFWSAVSRSLGPGVALAWVLAAGALGNFANAWVPVAAGLGILAMLGTGGERVDLWAHAFGLGAGVVLGIAASRIVPERPGPLWQWGAGLLGAGAILGSWLRALA